MKRPPVLKSVAIFNEDYVNSFVFQPNELLKSSNDIFIRDETYEAGLKEIEDHVDTLRKLFYEDQDIDELIKDLCELENSFGKQVKSGIHGSSVMFKAFSDGNKVRNIPKGLDTNISCSQNSQQFDIFRLKTLLVRSEKSHLTKL